MQKKKILDDSNYYKLKSFLFSNSEKGVSRQEILEYMRVSKFTLILELIYSYATEEDIKNFNIVDRRSKKRFEFELEKLKTLVEPISQEKCGSENEEVLEESALMEETGSIEDAMEYSEYDAYVLNLEKELPLGLVDLDNLPKKEEVPEPKYQNVMFDMTIFDFSKEDFFRILSGISNPKLLITEDLLDEIDYVNYPKSDYSNEQRKYAKSILKFLAQDKEGKWSQLEKAKTKKIWDAVKYAKQKNAIFITNNPRVMVVARLHNVKTRAFDYHVDENPFNPESELICGVDASAISISAKALAEKFKNFNSILIADLTVSELERVIDGKFPEKEKETANFILKCAALWGRVKPSLLRMSSADKSIVNFYNENQVSMVFTGDFGFGSRTRLCDIDYELVIKNKVRKSDFSRFFESNNIELENIVNYYTLQSSMVESVRNDFIVLNVYKFLLKRLIVNVFSQPCNLKEVENNKVRALRNDIIVLKTSDEIAIMILTNPGERKCKVWYSGKIENVPKRYQEFAV